MSKRKHERDELDYFERQLLDEILAMFRALNASYDSLEDKTGINKDMIEFTGFDGNDPYESKFNRYSGQLNSHGQQLPYYKRLLQGWRASTDRENLTKEDIVPTIEGTALKP